MLSEQELLLLSNFMYDDIKQNEARNVKIGFLTYKGQLKDGKVIKFTNRLIMKSEKSASVNKVRSIGCSYKKLVHTI